MGTVMMVLRRLDGQFLKCPDPPEFTSDLDEAALYDDAPCERYRVGSHDMTFVPVRVTTGGQVIPLVTRSTQPPTGLRRAGGDTGTARGRASPYGAARSVSESVEAGGRGTR